MGLMGERREEGRGELAANTNGVTQAAVDTARRYTRSNRSE